jgi:phage-related tail protein
MSNKAHMEEQRRRLEHFLSVAKQARARNDIKKIEELLEELLTSQKSLSHNRINELKHLEVMTSPYN